MTGEVTPEMAVAPLPPAAILLVGRNNLALTKLAVRSALAQDLPLPYGVLLVDNASTDGTGAWARAKDRIALIATEKQWSLSRCWNEGLRACFSAGYEAVLVLNNDVRIRPDTLRLLLEHGGEFVTCVSVGTEGECLGTRTVETLRGTERPHPDYSAFLLRRFVWEKVGGFNEDYYPAYVEDAEHHLRCHRAGVRAVSVDLPFLHYSAGTLKNCSPAEAAEVRRGADRNRAMFREAYGCAVGSAEYYALFEVISPVPSSSARGK